MLREKYRELNDSVHEKAKFVADGCNSLNASWDEFLPLLDQIQALLSQRGEARKQLSDAGLPVWSQWFKTFQKDIGLTATLRTLQNRLVKFRSKGEKKPKQVTPPVQFSVRNQRRLLKTMQCANDMVAAIDNGREYQDAMREYKRIAIPGDSIDHMLETLASAEDTQESPSTIPDAVAIAATPVTTPPALLQQPSSATQITFVPKPGDCTGLADRVGASCGESIKSVLEGLAPDLMADVFGKFAQRLAQMYCHCGREAEIKVTVQIVKRNPTVSKAA